MKFHYSLHGVGLPVIRDFSVRHGATTVERGALLVKGPTPGTNNGMLIVSGAAATDAMGILLEELTSTATDTTILATTDNLRKVQILPPGSVALAEYSLVAADDVAVVSSSTTTITVTDLEDDIDGAWVYVSAGTASLRQLRVLTASAAGSATMKSAFGTVLTSAESIVKVCPRLHQLLVITTNSVQLATTAAVGTARLSVLDNYIKDEGSIPFKPLDPVADSPRTLTASARLYSDVCINNHVLFPFD
mgnify:CR=1 FL=1